MNIIETTRFGKVEVRDEHVISFKDGIIGFSKLHHYVLVESPTVPIILWLQSMDSPETAFPVVEPWFFRRDFKVTLNDADRFSLDFKEGDRLKTFLILTIPENMTQMTVNLRGPIVLNLEKSTGSQVVLQDKSLDVRSPAHELFSKALSNFSLVQSLKDFDESSEEIWTAVNVKEAKKDRAQSSIDNL